MYKKILEGINTLPHAEHIEIVYVNATGDYHFHKREGFKAMSIDELKSKAAKEGKKESTDTGKKPTAAEKKAADEKLAAEIKQAEDNLEAAETDEEILAAQEALDALKSNS